MLTVGPDSEAAGLQFGRVVSNKTALNNIVQALHAALPSLVIASSFASPVSFESFESFDDTPRQSRLPPISTA